MQACFIPPIYTVSANTLADNATFCYLRAYEAHTLLATFFYLLEVAIRKPNKVHKHNTPGHAVPVFTTTGA